MKSSQVLNCIFDSWYSKFKNVTFDSEWFELPDDFIAYLLADGLVLPDRSNDNKAGKYHGYSSDEDDDDDNEDTWEDNGAAAAPAPSFPELDIAISNAIARLGGAVFPKLNWSSPKDATWLTLNHTLKCTEPNDIYLLLKGSNFITHDLTEPFKHCDDQNPAANDIHYKLVLRSWSNINVGMEFRCFVRDNHLIAISQRYHTNYFEFLQKDDESIAKNITKFYKKKIHEQFPDSSYVFDVYIDSGCVYLMDFNPFGLTTDPLMFTWHELNDTNDEDKWPLIRYNKESFMQGNVYQQFTVPKDFVDLANGDDPNKLFDLLHMNIRTQNEDTSSDGESIGG